MKNKLYLTLTLLMVMALTQSVSAYDFSAVAPTGQTLYYNILSDSSGVGLVWPNVNAIYLNDIWTGYIKPTGDLVIPNTISCNGREYVVRSMGSVFYGCTGLTSVTLPDSLWYIYGSAFASCTGIQNVTFGNSLRLLGYGCFANCSSLISVTLPNSVTSIGDFAFYNDSSLTTVSIPNSVTNAGSSIFGGCANITYPIFNNTLFIYMPPSYIGNYIIPTGVMKICGGAFYDCANLTSVSIPNTVSYIGEWAFRGTSSLTTITLPNTLDSIHTACFLWSGLSSVTIPASVKYIGDRAFCQCNGLSTVIIPDSVTEIGYMAFYNCGNLMTATIPSSVSYIGYDAFKSCNMLYSVTVLGSNAPYLGSEVFDSNSVSRKFYIPCKSYSSYYNNSSWNPYRSSLNEPGFEGNINLNMEASPSYMGWVDLQQYHGHYGIGCDSTAIILASANNHYHFDHWSNGAYANPLTIHLVGDSTITAFFLPDQYTIDVQSGNEERGSVSGGGTFDYGSIATITAVPNNGYHFTRWNDGNTENPRQVLVSGNNTYTAYFDISYYTVTVSSNDILRGSVQGGGSNYTYGMPATVEATPYSGYVLSQWSNGAYYNPYTFAVTEDVDLVAEFVAVGTMFRITTEVNNAALGHVEGGGMYGVGEYAMLTAVPNDNCWFEHWQDGSTDNPRQVYVGCDATYTAYFSSPGVGIPDAEADHSMTIHTDGRRIVVDGADGQEVRVFDIMGRMVDVDMGNGKGTASLVVPSAGVYLVKIDGRPARRIVVVK